MPSTDMLRADHPRLTVWMWFSDRLRLLLAFVILILGAAILAKDGHPVGWFTILLALTMFSRALRPASRARRRGLERTLLIFENVGQLVVLGALLHYAGAL